MRVGFVVYGGDRPLSGISRYTIELIEAMAGLDEAPDMVLITAGGAGPLAALNLETYQLHGSRRLPGLMTLGSVEIPLLARRHELDLLHDTTGVTPFGLTGGGAKRVVTIHDVIPLSFPNVSSRLDTLIYKHWLPRVLPNMDGIITVSECSRQDIVRHLNIESNKVYTTVEGANERFQPATSAEVDAVKARYGITERYILYVGSVEERKNLSRVLQAFAELGEVEQQLVIVGLRKWKYEHIESTLQALQLGDRVVFTGYVEDEDLPVLFSGAEVFVFPSLYEGFGLPVLEAMTSGTPVITSNVSSLPEVAGEAALTVDPYDVQAIARAMQDVLASPDLRESLRRQGLERATMFTWEEAARQTVDVYHKVYAGE